MQDEDGPGASTTGACSCRVNKRRQKRRGDGVGRPSSFVRSRELQSSLRQGQQDRFHFGASQAAVVASERVFEAALLVPVDAFAFVGEYDYVAYAVEEASEGVAFSEEVIVDEVAHHVDFSTAFQPSGWLSCASAS